MEAVVQEPVAERLVLLRVVGMEPEVRVDERFEGFLHACAERRK
jgi:hypothetical protein